MTDTYLDPDEQARREEEEYERNRCGVTQPGTLGYQHCRREKGHAEELHRSQDGREYAVDGAPSGGVSPTASSPEPATVATPEGRLPQSDRLALFDAIALWEEDGGVLVDDHLAPVVLRLVAEARAAALAPLQALGREGLGELLALVDEHDGCHQRVRDLAAENALAKEEGREPDHSDHDIEDAEWWNRRADAVLSLLPPAPVNAHTSSEQGRVPGATHPAHWARHGHPDEPCRDTSRCYGGASSEQEPRVPERAVLAAAESLFEEERNASMSGVDWGDWPGLDDETRGAYVLRAREVCAAAFRAIQHTSREQGSTCRHGQQESRCAACAACAACTGSCGVCPYTVSSEQEDDRG